LNGGPGRGENNQLVAVWDITALTGAVPLWSKSLILKKKESHVKRLERARSLCRIPNGPGPGGTQKVRGRLERDVNSWGHHHDDRKKRASRGWCRSSNKQKGTLYHPGKTAFLKKSKVHPEEGVYVNHPRGSRREMCITTPAVLIGKGGEKERASLVSKESPETPC